MIHLLTPGVQPYLQEESPAGIIAREGVVSRLQRVEETVEGGGSVVGEYYDPDKSIITQSPALVLTSNLNVFTIITKFAKFVALQRMCGPVRSILMESECS